VVSLHTSCTIEASLSPGLLPYTISLQKDQIVWLASMLSVQKKQI
jgi:hypothetical protein